MAVKKINIKQYVLTTKKFPAVFDTTGMDKLMDKVSNCTTPKTIGLVTNSEAEMPQRVNTDLKLQADIATPDDFHDYIESFNYDEDFEGKEKKEKKKTRQGFQGVSGMGDGNHFDSKWEYGYFVYMRDIKGNTIERNTADYLYYVDAAGKRRKFYYDFVVNGSQLVETKGIFRANDVLKMEQCPQVHFVYGDEMKQILKTLKKEKPDWETGFIPD